MLRTSIFIAALLAPAAALAATPAMTIGERDGVRFEYASQLKDNGQIQLVGKLLANGEPFDLTVEPGGLVHGDIGYSYVEFSVSRRQREKLVGEVASRAALPVAAAAQSIATSGQ